MKRLTMCLALIALLALPVRAAITSFTVTVDNPRPHVGDPVTIEARCMVKQGEQATFNPDFPETDDLVFGRPETTVEHLPDGFDLYRLRVTVQAFKLDTLELGRISVQVGDQVEERDVPGIEVVSVLAEKKGPEAPNPLKPQMDIRPDYRHLAKLAALIAGVLLGLWLLFFLVRKLVRRIRNRDHGAAPEQPALPPYEEFQAAMTELLGTSYLKDGEVKAFYVALSDIGKRYVGRVLALDAEVETTAEMLDQARDHLDTSEYRMLADFLESCDLVKFAKVVPDQGETNRHVNLLYQLAERIHNRLESPLDDTREGRDVPV